MSNIAFKRDINDFETISSFCNEVQSVERLRLLYVLTVVDIKAVGPNIWKIFRIIHRNYFGNYDNRRSILL